MEVPTVLVAGMTHVECQPLCKQAPCRHPSSGTTSPVEREMQRAIPPMYSNIWFAKREKLERACCACEGIGATQHDEADRITSQTTRHNAQAPPARPREAGEFVRSICDMNSWGFAGGSTHPRTHWG